MRRAHFIVVLSLLSNPLYASGQNPRPENRAGPSTEYRVTANVDLVLLDVAVRNRNGDSVAGLGAGNFQVIENGEPQPITLFRKEDSPVTIGLIVDCSTSMLPKRRETIGAALAFVEVSNPADDVFVVNFNENVSLGLPPSVPFSSDRAALEKALLAVPAAGRTALLDALAKGFEHLPLGRHERQALIVFSDGGDNESSHSLQDIVSLVEQSEATVYTIGLYTETDRDRNPGVLRRLARVSGGKAFFPNSLKRIGEICRDIASEIRSRYVIGYVPQDVHNGEYRALEVKVHVPGRPSLQVRTRTGFRVPPR